MKRTNISTFKLIGLQLDKKTTKEGEQANNDCGYLWQKFEKENFVELIPDKLGDEIYAVYFNYEGNDFKYFSYFIGCKVEINTEAPQGMDSLLIPTENYMKITVKGKMTECIIDAWKVIVNSKIKRTFKYDFEVYDERSKDWNNSEMEIFVATY